MKYALINGKILKSGLASCTQTRPISNSLFPKCPIGGVLTFALKASGYAFSSCRKWKTTKETKR